jgi:hypothetical protein
MEEEDTCKKGVGSTILIGTQGHSIEVHVLQQVHEHGREENDDVELVVYVVAEEVPPHQGWKFHVFSFFYIA